jgi:hypothetical protein
MDQDDPEERIAELERQHADAVQSDDEEEAADAASHNALGGWLVLGGAAALAIAMFLPLFQEVGGLQTHEHNTLFQQRGPRSLALPVFLVVSGFYASQGKRSGRWSLIALCAVAAVDVVLEGVVAGTGVAIYFAGTGVAAAFIGALTFFGFQGKSDRGHDD